MLLGKEHSLVADSTVSSSPQSDSNTHIHRPVRTYGRRRDDAPTNDLDAPSSSLAPTSASRDSIHNTAPPGLSEEIPPSSPHASDCEISMSNADEASPEPLPKFEFSWKKQLRHLDEDDDLEVSTSISNTKDVASILECPNAMASTLIDDVDVFGGSHPSVDTRSPLHSASVQGFHFSSPQVGTRTRTRRKVVCDSDSDSEHSKGSPLTTPASALHLINTPNSGSSFTQPTSEDDIPSAVSTKLSGRRKTAPSSRVFVTPLTFIEGPSNNEIRSDETRKKKSKIKAPTKKDLVDTIKERGRLAAQSAVVIPRNEKRTKFTVGNLLAKVQDGVFKSQSTLGDRIPPSDPIEPFSSPDNVICGASEHTASPRCPTQPPAALSNEDQESPDQNDSDDSDLPEISNVFKSNVEDSRKKQALKEAKAKVLARLQPSAMDSDDDLEIVAFSSVKTTVKEEDIQRKSRNKPRISEGRKRQMQFGKVGLIVQEKERTFTLSPGRGGLTKVTDQNMLNQLIAVEARKEAQRVTRKKEEEWRKHGGQVTASVLGQGQGLANAVKTIAEKGLKAAEARKTSKEKIDDSEDERESDEDWEPELRGSASPQILPVDADSALNEKEHENVPPNEDVTMIDGFEVMEDDANIRARTARRLIVDSESEDENENVHPGLLAIPREERYRRSSCELPTEDEYDKENNVSLMYDRSEDKENNAVVRLLTSTFDIRGDSPSLPDFTQSKSLSENVLPDEEPNSDRRQPLGELPSEASPISSPIGRSNLMQSFAAKLQQVSPSSNTLTPFLAREETLQPAFDTFSQLSEGEPDIFRPAPLLQPGFADLFESATERQKAPREFDGKLSGDRHSGAEELQKLRRTDTLNLTQDVSLAFQAENRLIRKADAIFEKEQAFVLEAATKKVHNSKPDLYVNELGFLTQTRPGVQSPEIYRPSSPTQSLLSVSRQQSFLSPFPTRPPLRTLSFTSQLESPEQQPAGRLKRYRSPSRSRGSYEPESSKPQKLNAFEVLAGGRETTAKDHRERKRLDLSEFLADEAAESDDDDRFGFMKATSKDEEEDGEDMDKSLDVLMDDRDMDEDTIAADLVHEKFKEQEDEQDKEVEKLHLAAVQGELRLKRNRGVGVDDSDEESDNEDNERARRAMKKLRTTDRGDIKELEGNADTRAFADTYNQGLKDDDQEFAYLEKESQLEASADDVGYKSREDEEEDEEEVDEPQKFISPDEMQRLVREQAKEERDEYGMDTNDVSWLDLKEEEQPRVKALKRHMVRSQNPEQLEVDESLGPAFCKSASSITGSNKRFVQENKSRNMGTSRSVGGSAVTGHTKKQVKTGPPSKASLVARPVNPASTSIVNRQVKPAESMLSVIADKRQHFA